MLDTLLSKLEMDLQESVVQLLAQARIHIESALAKVDKARAHELAEAGKQQAIVDRHSLRARPRVHARGRGIRSASG
jgi:hypothetical protein